MHMPCHSNSARCALFLLACLMLLAALPGTAHAASQIGSVLTMQGEVTAVGDAGERALQPESPVYLHDRIETKADSSVEIQFLDKTLLAQGESSIIDLSTYVYSQEETDSELLFNLTTGTFRMATGQIVKQNPDAFKLVSPLSTVGIRGTVLFVQIRGGFQHVGLERITPGRILEVRSDLFTETLDQVNTFVLVRPDGTITRPAATPPDLFDGIRDGAPFSSRGQTGEPDDDPDPQGTGGAAPEGDLTALDQDYGEEAWNTVTGAVDRTMQALPAGSGQELQSTIDTTENFTSQQQLSEAGGDSEPSDSTTNDWSGSGTISRYSSSGSNVRGEGNGDVNVSITGVEDGATMSAQTVTITENTHDSYTTTFTVSDYWNDTSSWENVVLGQYETTATYQGDQVGTSHWMALLPTETSGLPSSGLGYYAGSGVGFYYPEAYGSRQDITAAFGAAIDFSTRTIDAELEIYLNNKVWNDVELTQVTLQKDSDKNWYFEFNSDSNTLGGVTSGWLLGGTAGTNAAELGFTFHLYESGDGYVQGVGGADQNTDWWEGGSSLLSYETGTGGAVRVKVMDEASLSPHVQSGSTVADWQLRIQSDDDAQSQNQYYESFRIGDGTYNTTDYTYIYHGQWTPTTDLGASPDNYPMTQQYWYYGKRPTLYFEMPSQDYFYVLTGNGNYLPLSYGTATGTTAVTPSGFLMYTGSEKSVKGTLQLYHSGWRWGNLELASDTDDNSQGLNELTWNTGSANNVTGMSSAYMWGNYYGPNAEEVAMAWSASDGSNGSASGIVTGTRYSHVWTGLGTVNAYNTLTGVYEASYDADVWTTNYAHPSAGTTVNVRHYALTNSQPSSDYSLSDSFAVGDYDFNWYDFSNMALGAYSTSQTLAGNPVATSHYYIGDLYPGTLASSGTATYVGHGIGLFLPSTQGSSVDMTATVELDVNFATKGITGTVNTYKVSGSSVSDWKTATISGVTWGTNGLNFGADSGDYQITGLSQAYISGMFFGSDRSEVGGVWDFTDTDGQSLGAYGSKNVDWYWSGLAMSQEYQTSMGYWVTYEGLTDSMAYTETSKIISSSPGTTFLVVDHDKTYTVSDLNYGEYTYTAWGTWDGSSWTDGTGTGTTSTIVMGKRYVDNLPTSGSATYSGELTGSFVTSSNLVQQSSPVSVSGTVGITANFGSQNVSGTLNVVKNSSNWATASFSTSMSNSNPHFSGSMIGTGVDTNKSKVTGNFYGPNAAEVGGTFRVSKSDGEARGVYRAKQ